MMLLPRPWLSPFPAKQTEGIADCYVWGKEGVRPPISQSVCLVSLCPGKKHPLPFKESTEVKLNTAWLKSVPCFPSCFHTFYETSICFLLWGGSYNVGSVVVQEGRVMISWFSLNTGRGGSWVFFPVDMGELLISSHPCIPLHNISIGLSLHHCHCPLSSHFIWHDEIQCKIL